MFFEFSYVQQYWGSQYHYNTATIFQVNQVLPINYTLILTHDHFSRTQVFFNFSKGKLIPFYFKYTTINGKGSSFGHSYLSLSFFSQPVYLENIKKLDKSKVTCLRAKSQLVWKKTLNVL